MGVSADVELWSSSVQVALKASGSSETGEHRKCPISKYADQGGQSLITWGTEGYYYVGEIETDSAPKTLLFLQRRTWASVKPEATLFGSFDTFQADVHEHRGGVLIDPDSWLSLAKRKHVPIVSLLVAPTEVPLSMVPNTSTPPGWLMWPLPQWSIVSEKK